MFSERSSPAVVSAAAASELPRAALYALLIAFVFPMLFSGDVWSGRSMAFFGVALNMANGSLIDWLLPNINSLNVTDSGPLAYWVAAFGILTVGKIFTPAVGYHITGAIWFAITIISLWHGTYMLAKKDEAQPISFAFGGEAARQDYSRLVADIAVLMLVSSYGLVVAFFELTPNTALLAFSALSFYGIVLSLENLNRGSVIAGVSIGAATLTATVGVGLWFTFSAWLAIFFTPDYTSRTKRAFITLTVAFIVALLWFLLVVLIYPVNASEWFSSWLTASLRDFAPLPLHDYLKLGKNLAWLTFPTWPFAIWGIYAWRHFWKQAPLAIPLSFLVIAIFSILFTGVEATTTILCIMPSLAVLASLGIVSLKRSKENFLDLYSGVVFTLAVIASWLYFFAWTTGTPVKMAYSLTRLAPHAVHRTSIFLFILAVLVTIAWIAMVVWRLRKHPSYAWRGAWLSAAGLTAVWIITMSLFVHLIDGARSLKHPVQNVERTLRPLIEQGSCINQKKLSVSDMGAFLYWGNIKFTPGDSCPYRLEAIDSSDLSPLFANRANVVDIFNARPRSSYRFILYKQAAK